MSEKPALSNVHALILSPGDPPLMEEGQPIPAFVYLVSSGSLILTVTNPHNRAKPSQAVVGPGCILGTELLLLPEESVPPLAGFSARVAERCILDRFDRADIQERVARDAATWNTRILITMDFMLRFARSQTELRTPGGPIRRPSQPGSHGNNLQQAYRTLETKHQLVLGSLTLLDEKLAPLAKGNRRIEQARTMLHRLYLEDPTLEFEGAKFIKAFLLDRVIPLLQLCADNPSANHALDLILHLVPEGRKRSGVVPSMAATDEVDQGELPTSPEGIPAFKG